MTAILILASLAGLALGGWGGWAAGRYLLNKKMLEDNTFLKQHIYDLKETIIYWQNQANFNRDIQNKTITNHNTNLSDTLHIILNILQNQQKDDMKENEKQQVAQLIETIKGTNEGISVS